MKNFAFVFLIACGSGPAPRAPSPAGPVTLGDWCHTAGDKMCATLGGRCGGGDAMADGCREQFAPSCLAGRDANAASGKSGPDLDHCLHTLDTVPCSGIADPAQLAPCTLTAAQ